MVSIDPFFFLWSVVAAFLSPFLKMARVPSSERIRRHVSVADDKNWPGSKDSPAGREVGPGSASGQDMVEREGGGGGGVGRKRRVAEGLCV